MLDLIVSDGGILSTSLIAQLKAFDHEARALPLSEVEYNAASFKAHLELLAQSGRYYNNIFIDLTFGFNEIEAFEADHFAATRHLERRINGMLRALKFGAQHMARSDGGKIWVLCFDHSVSMSVSTVSNPITNFAAMAAVQCLAKEIMHFDVSVNLFLMHPPRENVEPAEWRSAKNNLHVYGLKYKPQSAQHVCETIRMYSELKHLTTTGGLIPLGAGVAIANI